VDDKDQELPGRQRKRGFTVVGGLVQGRGLCVCVCTVNECIHLAAAVGRVRGCWGCWAAGLLFWSALTKTELSHVCFVRVRAVARHFV
jgi:hypothetical protein